MTLVRATSADLPRMAECAADFLKASASIRESLKQFSMERFQALWAQLLDSGAGAIFALVEAGNIVGAIGGVIHPEPYTGEMVAAEMFWFVQEGHRGGGMKLYQAFAGWAGERGCKQIRICHMLDSMPEKLQKVYRRMGFKPVEVHYIRELSTCQSQPQQL